MISLYCGDALDLLPTLDGPFDAIITDLPYGTTACKWDTVIPFGPMWAQVKRLLKPRGAFVTTASQPFTSAIVMSNPRSLRHEWIWEKAHAANFMAAKYGPLAKHESVLVFADESPTYNPQITQGPRKLNRSGATIGERGKDSIYGTRPPILANVPSTEYYPSSVQYFSAGAMCDRVHPTQKPVALYEYLIRTYTNEGDTVLDFCMGSGTTGVAAVNTGRSFVGVEMDAGYFAIAQRRIADAQAQLALPILEVAAS